jgi:putative transposase
VQKAAYRSPNTVAFVERFNQTLRQELLEHFIVFGERHLNHLVSVFIDYYHRLRPHQAKENELLVPVSRRKKQRRRQEPTEIPLSEIRCEDRLGGLLKHYYRKAA